MQTAQMRERLFTMRMSEEESERLDKLEAHYGLGAASVIRMLLKRDEDRLIHGEAGQREVFASIARTPDRVGGIAAVSGRVNVRAWAKETSKRAPKGGK